MTYEDFEYSTPKSGVARNQKGISGSLTRPIFQSYASTVDKADRRPCSFLTDGADDIGWDINCM